MEVKLKNVHLTSVQRFMFDLKLKSKQSRQRTKFIKLLDDGLNKLAEKEQELLKEHCHLDENGEPKKTDDGTKWDVKDINEFAKDRNELYSGEFTITDTNKDVKLEEIKVIIENVDVELSGRDAIVYDELCEAFEQMGQEETEVIDAEESA